MKKSRIDTNFLERYAIDKHAAKKGVQFENDKNSVIEINCIPSSQTGLIEHIIEEVDLDNYLPSTSVIEDGSQVIEVVPDIADRDETSFRSVDATSKWTPSDTFTFLEAIKAVLTEEEISGGYLSRKNLFEKVAELLKEHGSNVSSTDVEKKYNNMLITYRRCQKRLIQKKQAPLWPYFKLFDEIRSKDIQLNNIPSEIVPKKRKLVTESLLHLVKKKEHDTITQDLPSSLIRDPSGWKEKRSQLNQKKKLLIEGLLTSAKEGRKKEEPLRGTLRELDEIEIAYLSAIKLEVKKTANVMTDGLKILKTSLVELKNILVNKI